ncbi:hypothetical protein LY78DRAFT_38813 [Colletotrichum sublineola]|nr:hypothetical protein LY78DRAFT_38813 [Colletotrichum sublineola]
MYLRYLALHKDPVPVPVPTACLPYFLSAVLPPACPSPLIAEVLLCCSSSPSPTRSLAPLLSPPHSTPTPDPTRLSQQPPRHFLLEDIPILVFSSCLVCLILFFFPTSTITSHTPCELLSLSPRSSCRQTTIPSPSPITSQSNPSSINQTPKTPTFLEISYVHKTKRPTGKTTTIPVLHCH